MYVCFFVWDESERVKGQRIYKKKISEFSPLSLRMPKGPYIHI